MHCVRHPYVAHPAGPEIQRPGDRIPDPAVLRLDRNSDATERRRLVKAVFDDPEFDSNNPEESLKAVFYGISTGLQWRDHLITHPSAIEYSEQGFISFFAGIEGCEGVLPMKSSRLSGYHIELYSWCLYCDLVNIPYEPFNKIGYAECKVNDELPYLYYDGLNVDNHNHWLAIIAETNPADWSLKRFCLQITRDDGPKESEITDKLNQLLLNEGFVQGDEECVMIKYIEDYAEIKIFLPHLFDRLLTLSNP